MCHPAILAAVSVAGSLAGGAVQAQGARQQADAQAKAEERRAELADRQKAADELRERGARVIGDIDASGQVGEGMLFVHPKSARGVLINLVE